MKWLEGSLKDILIALRYLLSVLFARPEEAKNHPVNVEPPKPIKKTPREIVVDAAVKAVGLDLTPKDEVPDEVSCVAQLTKVLDQTPYGLFQSLTYTPYLLNVLKSHPHWTPILAPKSGCVVVSPTQGDNVGHCGIFITDQLIASNNSFGTYKGKFTQNYSWEIWVARFKREKGLRIYIFEPVDNKVAPQN